MAAGMAITFILPALNESGSLIATVRSVRELAAEHLQEVLIVTAGYATPACLETSRRLAKEMPDVVRVYRQRRPGLGCAIQEAFDEARGTHWMLMASDLETDPRCVPRLMETMREGRWDIVTASRWLPGGGFQGYGGVKRVLNRLFQQGLRLAYGTQLTDLTFAYRLYRREVLEGIRWEQSGHAFLLECLLKPLRLGARVTEAPCPWQRRSEGAGAGSLRALLGYVPLAVRVRGLRPEQIRPPRPRGIT